VPKGTVDCRNPCQRETDVAESGLEGRQLKTIPEHER